MKVKESLKIKNTQLWAGLVRGFLQGGSKTFFILLAGIIVGFAALCLVHLLPVDRMHRNVLNSKDTIGACAQVVMGYKSTSLDNFTDSIILNQAICPSDAPLLEKVVYNYQVNYWRDYEQPENLDRYLAGETGYRYQGYTHYWGGHQVILKPLLLIFDYADILVINMILQMVFLILVIAGLYRTGKDHMIFPLLTGILSIMPIAMALCLQLCDIYYITLVGMMLIVWKYDKIEKERMYLLFLILGMATSYFDFLTYPLVSLGLPLIIFLAYLDGCSPFKKFFYTILCSVEWCIGYLGMWMGKWILGSILVTGSGSLKVAIESIRYRGSNVSSDGLSLTVFSVLLKNLYVYLRWPIMLLIGGVALYLIKQVIARGNLSKIDLKSLIPCGVVGVYPIVWYMLAKNHSYEHTFMAYRELVIMTFAGLSILAEAGKNVSLKRENTS